MEQKIIDKYRMDSNKMLWHLYNIQQWQEQKDVAPIHIDMGLSKGCNQHCKFCYGMFQGNTYSKGVETVFPREALLNFIEDAGKLGVKSLGFIGEGEPLVNPAVYEAVGAAQKSGIDVGMATNGALLDQSQTLEMLKGLTYIRFNVSAGTEKGYRKIHRVPKGEFEQVIKNIAFCVNLKKEHNLNVTIGLQMVLIQEGIKEVIPLAKLGRDLGVDYLVVKHCSDSPDRRLNIDHSMYTKSQDIFIKAENYSNENYKVFIKWSKLMNLGKKTYSKCQAVPFFMMRITGDGKLFPCAQFYDYRPEEFIIADLTKERFKDVMFKERYKEVADKISNLDVHKECMTNCKENSINDFLWELTYNKPEHINFV